MTPSKTAAPSPIILNELKPPGAARLVLFLHKKQFIGTVSLWHLKTENLLLFAEVKTGRCHFKNKMLGNEGPQKRLVALAEFGSMFVLADVPQKQVHFCRLHRLDLPLRCQTMLTHIWLIVGFMPKFCMPSSALPIRSLSFSWIRSDFSLWIFHSYFLVRQKKASLETSVMPSFAI